MRANIAAKIISTKANVPDMMLVKYKAAIKTAITNLIILSVEPMFFFIVYKLKLNKKLRLILRLSKVKVAKKRKQ